MSSSTSLTPDRMRHERRPVVVRRRDDEALGHSDGRGDSGAAGSGRRGSPAVMLLAGGHGSRRMLAAGGVNEMVEFEMDRGKSDEMVCTFCFYSQKSKSNLVVGWRPEAVFFVDNQQS
jgi:hypothetical protein